MMNAAHLHLISTHAPVVGTAVGFGLLAAAALRRSRELERAGLVILALTVALVLPAYLSGAPAEEWVKGMPGIPREAIEQHAELAQIALVVAAVLGVTALAGLIVFRKRPTPRWFAMGTLALSLLAGGLLGWTANLGGKIRHAEARPEPADYSR